MTKNRPSMVPFETIVSNDATNFQIPFASNIELNQDEIDVAIGIRLRRMTWGYTPEIGLLL